MRYKRIERIPEKKTKKKDKCRITAQEVAGYLILDIYEAAVRKYRYAMDTKTYEYGLMIVETGIWHNKKLFNCYYGWSRDIILAKEDSDIIDKALGAGKFNKGLSAIEERESDYGSDRRERAYNSKATRIDKLMKRVPPVPEDFAEWIIAVIGADMQYAFWDKESTSYSCTACGKIAKEVRKLDISKDTKIRNKDMVECPHCKAHLQVKKRWSSAEMESKAMLLNEIDDKMSVARHFDVCVHWEYGKKRSVAWDEGTRIFLYINDPKWKCRIYYRQYPKNYSTVYIGLREPWWDTNSQNRRTGTCYLYPENIASSLKGTGYQQLTRFFEASAKDKRALDYNTIMYNLSDCGQQLEYLYKGRYYRLLREMIINLWSWRTILHHSSDIKDITGIQDMQLIHRLRNRDGGINTMEWLRHTEETQEKISDKALDFYEKNKIRVNRCIQQLGNMSPEQVMNYLIRQQEEQYPYKTYEEVLEQWNDYWNMCQNLKKQMNDPMIYRPKELKRRHDEAVKEINRLRIIESMNRNAAEKAARTEEMRKKYPGAEKILQEIKEKYEYQSEEYLVIVPNGLMDIITEGQTLHHCVGATDRYFDRIRARETYILFLRKAEDAEVPYYTLEVEPNGTIRQHRSYYDEEPNIEQIRGFLKEWQQVVKKRMSKEDHQYAERSRQLRQKNIRELQEANNTRVLKGLEEDFLEAE